MVAPLLRTMSPNSTTYSRNVPGGFVSQSVLFCHWQVCQSELRDRKEAHSHSSQGCCMLESEMKVAHRHYCTPLMPSCRCRRSQGTQEIGQDHCRSSFQITVYWYSFWDTVQCVTFQDWAAVENTLCKMEGKGSCIRRRRAAREGMKGKIRRFLVAVDPSSAYARTDGYLNSRRNQRTKFTVTCKRCYYSRNIISTNSQLNDLRLHFAPKQRRKTLKIRDERDCRSSYSQSDWSTSAFLGARNHQFLPLNKNDGFARIRRILPAHPKWSLGPSSLTACASS